MHPTLFLNVTLYLYIWLYEYSLDLVSFDKGSLTSQMSPFLAYSGINDIKADRRIWLGFCFFRDLGQGWPGISMQPALASLNCNKAASHNQHWLCLNFPFSKMPMFPFSVLQMWSDGYLAMRFVLCNSFWLFTWEPHWEESLTRREGKAELNLISFTLIMVRACDGYKEEMWWWSWWTPEAHLPETALPSASVLFIWDLLGGLLINILDVRDAFSLVNKCSIYESWLEIQALISHII